MTASIFDIRTITWLLCFGNLTCVLLILSYLLCIKDAGDRDLAKSVISAKFFFAIGFLLIALRGVIPDFLSINIGNSLGLLGGYFEARSLLMICNAKKTWMLKFVGVVALLSISVLNLASVIQPQSLLRNTMGSFGMFAIVLLPALKLLFCECSTPFKKIIGIFYLLFIGLMLPRGVYFILNPTLDPFTSSTIQGLSFAAFLLLTIFSLSAFLLLVKEEADKKLQALARTDFLTGLNNRKTFLDSVAGPFERHRREGTKCSVLFMDIDHFKQVNDTHGHAFGDEVLKATATVLRMAVRGYDIPGRLGGEEFAAFIDDARPNAGQIVAERIRKHIKETSFKEHPDFKYTISIGVATGVPRTGDVFEQFLNTADEALYEAKNTGRDKVVERDAREKAA